MPNWDIQQFALPFIYPISISTAGLLDAIKKSFLQLGIDIMDIKDKIVGEAGDGASENMDVRKGLWV